MHSAFSYFPSLSMLLHLLSQVAAWESERVSRLLLSLIDIIWTPFFFTPISIGITFIHGIDYGWWRVGCAERRYHTDTREPDRHCEGSSDNKILACVSQAPSASPGKFLQRCRNGWCSFSSLPTALTEPGCKFTHRFKHLPQCSQNKFVCQFLTILSKDIKTVCEPLLHFPCASDWHDYMSKTRLRLPLVSLRLAKWLRTARPD